MQKFTVLMAMAVFLAATLFMAMPQASPRPRVARVGFVQEATLRAPVLATAAVPGTVPTLRLRPGPSLGQGTAQVTVTGIRSKSRSNLTTI